MVALLVLLTLAFAVARWPHRPADLLQRWIDRGYAHVSPAPA